MRQNLKDMIRTIQCTDEYAERLNDVWGGDYNKEDIFKLTCYNFISVYESSIGNIESGEEHIRLTEGTHDFNINCPGGTRFGFMMRHQSNVEIKYIEHRTPEDLHIKFILNPFSNFSFELILADGTFEYNFISI